MSWKLFGQIVALMVVAALIMIGMRSYMRPAVYRPMPSGMEGRQMYPGMRPGAYTGMRPDIRPPVRPEIKPEVKPEAQPPAPTNK